MIVSPESPLRRLPQRLNRKAVLFLDGIRLAIEMAETSLDRLGSAFLELSKDGTPPDQVQPLVVSALLDAWAIVDSTHRLRALLQHMPGLKQGLPELQVFYRHTKNAETLRHFVQHIRERVPSVAERAVPLWGILSWRTKTEPETGRERGYSIISGTFYPDVRAEGAVFGEPVHATFGFVTLNAGGTIVDLPALIERMKPLVPFFEAFAAPQSVNEPLNGSDQIMVFEMTPIRGEPEASAQPNPPIDSAPSNNDL